MQTTFLSFSALFIIGITGSSSANADTQDAGWMTEPTLHGDRLVFVSEGDLFGANLRDGTAHRLTSHEGAEYRPSLSPDGRWIAFTGEYGGNPDIFVMPARGGAPRQLTHHPDGDAVVGWSADGSSVLFRSGRTHPHGRSELWKVPLEGGMTTQPEYATWTLKDGWDIENYGVDPDIEVDNTPHDHVEGRDRQLERAIEELERRIREMPVEIPSPPAYPE